MRVLLGGVKPLTDSCWAGVSIRTLYTVAAYHGLRASHSVGKAALTQSLFTRLFAAGLGGRLATLLTPADRALLADLTTGVAPALDGAALRFPWQLADPRPPAAALQPLERLMAFGLVLPVRGPDDCRLLLPAPVAQALTPAVAALPPLPGGGPPAPCLADAVADAVTILAQLAGAPARHAPVGGLDHATLRRLSGHCAALPGGPRRRTARLRLLHTILHEAGLLTLLDGRCTPTAAVPAFLDQPPTTQVQTLLHAWAAGPLPPAALPPDLRAADVPWPALIAALLARLTAVPTHAVALPALLAAWTVDYGPLLRPPLLHTPRVTPLPSLVEPALLTALLTGPAALLGVVQTDGHALRVDLGVRAAESASTGLPSAPPPVLLNLMVTVALTAAPALRVALTPWTVHQRTPDGHCYRFTPASLAQGAHLLGSYRPLRDLLTRHFAALPPALTQLLATHSGLPPQPLRRGARVAPPPAAPATDTTLHLILALRRAAETLPDYALRFTQLAESYTVGLTLPNRATLEDLWDRVSAPLPAEEILTAGTPPPPPADPVAIRHALTAAIAAAVPICIRYYTAGRHAIGRRVIHPLALDPPYLTAYCRVRASNRTFHLDRILALEPVTGFALPPTPPPALPVTPTAPPAVGLLPDYDDAVA